METISGGSWLAIGDECPLRASASDRDEIYMVFGKPPYEHEITFSTAALRDFIAKGRAALAQLDAIAAKEQAELRSAS
jgi:hypothetical protein